MAHQPRPNHWGGNPQDPPTVIVNDDALGILPLKVIVPITDWKPQFAKADWLVRLDPDSTNQLSKVSAADCFQVRSVSDLRLVKKIGEVGAAKMSQIEDALGKVLKIN